MSHKEIVCRFIQDNFLFGDDRLLAQETSFLEEGIIDSTGILELIMFLEETFEITIEDAELVPENLDSLMSIERFISAKLSAREGLQGMEDQGVRMSA